MAARFTGRSAAVTGAGGGLGAAAACALAREGACVTVFDLDADAAAETAQRIRDEGGTATHLSGDVSSASDIERLMATAAAATGRLDLLFNNAGISKWGNSSVPLAEVDEEAFDRILSVNVRGVWLCMKAAIPRMIAGGGGRIVNVSSITGLAGMANLSIYSASKHAVIGLTKSAAIEYGRQGVRVNAICPGVHATAQGLAAQARFGAAWEERLARAYPATGRMGEIAEAIALVLFLLSDEASNIHGTAIPVDGGFSAQ